MQIQSVFTARNGLYEEAMHISFTDHRLGRPWLSQTLSLPEKQRQASFQTFANGPKSCQSWGSAR